MGNRIFVGVVVTLWAGTMSWLMVAHILPPFFHGEPPSHGAIIHEPVCWEIHYGDRVVGPDLILNIHTGDSSRAPVSYPIPSASLLTSELVPESKLLPIYVGRKWQQEVYSPFRAPGSSLEIVQAEVVDEQLIEHRSNRV